MRGQIHAGILAKKALPHIVGQYSYESQQAMPSQDAFLNLLAQSYGALQEPLCYIVCPNDEPNEFEMEEQCCMFQLPLEGEAFNMDNQKVHLKLKSFLINTPGWAWIEEYDESEDGQGAFQAWSDHYNGQGELSKHMALAKTKLKDLFYKNERGMSFKNYSSKMKCCFQMLDRDPEE